MKRNCQIRHGPAFFLLSVGKERAKTIAPLGVPIRSKKMYYYSVGSQSRVGDVVVYVFDTNQPSLPTPFYSVLVSVSVFMALSTVFHSIHSPDNSPLFHPVLSAFMKASLSPEIILCD